METMNKEVKTDDIVDKMVDRFLSWPLPQSVCSDTCVTDPKYPNRIGTNLLTSDEARQMIEYLFEALPMGETMKHKPDIQKILKLDAILNHANETDNMLFDFFGEREYLDHYQAAWETVKDLRDEMFMYITGSPFTLGQFYNLFDSPTGTKGLKPVAWDDEGYIPDQIVNVLMIRSVQTLDKIDKVTKLYKKCKTVARKFNKKMVV